MENKSTLVKIVMDPFCFKQFDPAAGSLFINYDKTQLSEKVNEFYLTVKDQGGLHDGYAPFCKHLFIENFTEAISGYTKITKENEGFMRSAYESRRENELPVLNRWIDRKLFEEQLGHTIPKAKYLDIILYSKAQVQEENKATGYEDPNKDVDYDYGIVSIKPQDDNHETPMQPITMMRNALGKEHGGSGEESILKELKRITYCPDCLTPITEFCESCNAEALTIVIYHHIVPKINGYLASDEECSACQLLKIPQQDYNMVYLCEKELPEVVKITSHSDFVSGSPLPPDQLKELKKGIEVLDYYLQMSSDALFIQCSSCYKVVSRGDYLDHPCH